MLIVVYLGDFLYSLFLFICLLKINYCHDEQDERIEVLEKRIKELEIR